MDAKRGRSDMDREDAICAVILCREVIGMRSQYLMGRVVYSVVSG